MKRSIDTRLWQKPWFMRLSPTEKLAWMYLLSNCDDVGVWDANTMLADFMLGDEIDWLALSENCNDNIVILDNGKWWIRDFCDFQYGKLKTNYKTHKPYIALLKQHDLYEAYTKNHSMYDEKHTMYDSQHRSNDENHRSNEKKDTISLSSSYSLDIEKEKKEFAEYIKLTEKQYSNLVERYGEKNTKKAIEKLNNYKAYKGKKYKSDYHALLNWVFDAIGAQEQRAPPQRKCKKCGAGMGTAGEFCAKCGWEWTDDGARADSDRIDDTGQQIF